MQTVQNKQSHKVLRHPLSVRLTHWLVALSGFVLLFSGFGQLPMYKRYNVIKLPGMAWAGDYDITFVLHLAGAAVFGMAILFHTVYHLRRREFSALPRKGDFKESVEIIKAMLTGGKEPPHEKFLAEQRLAYAAIGLVSLVLFITGLIKVYKNMGAITLDPGFLAVVTLVHTFATPVFLLLVIAHVGAFIIKENRTLVPSMVTGFVSREYVEHRHPRWNYPGRETTPAASSTEPAPIPAPAPMPAAPTHEPVASDMSNGSDESSSAEPAVLVELAASTVSDQERDANNL